MPAQSDERKRVLSFTLGYIVHASGDLFGHSYVDLWSGGSWPELSDADGISDGDKKIIIRHNAVEQYIENLMPEKFNTAAYNAIATPQQFIYDNFVTNGKAPNYDNVSSDVLDISFFNLFLNDAVSSRKSDRRNFKASGNHRVLLSGDRVQNVGMAITGTSDSQFNILEITGSGEVKFITKVTVAKLFKHNNRIFTISDSRNSIFPDYDGDGQRDDIDAAPCPPEKARITDSIIPETGNLGIIDSTIQDVITQSLLTLGFCWETGCRNVLIRQNRMLPMKLYPKAIPV